MTTNQNQQVLTKEQNDQIVAQGGQMKELIEHPGWPIYVAVLNNHIKARDSIIALPICEIAPGASSDFHTRVAGQELVKGAINGIRLAITLPQAIIDHAALIIEERQPSEDEE